MRAAYPAGSGKTIWCFTGDVLEELMPGGRHHTEVTDRILACLDMLVDGPFVQDLYDISLRFRGSSNQRVIDMNATRARAEREGRPLELKMWLFPWLTWLVIGTIVMVLGYMLFSDAYRYETLMTAGVTAFILLVSLTQRHAKVVAQTA